MKVILIVVFTVAYILLPIWVAIHAWRKEYKTWAIIIGVSFLLPLLPQAIALIAFFVVKPYRPNWDFIPNPKVYIGWGTTFYGAADRNNADNSFVTSQWFCAFYIPLIPIQSYRVIYGEGHSRFYGTYITSSESYSIIEALSLNLKQVVQAYILILSFVFFVVLMVFSMKNQQNALNTDVTELMTSITFLEASHY